MSSTQPGRSARLDDGMFLWDAPTADTRAVRGVLSGVGTRHHRLLAVEERQVPFAWVRWSRGVTEACSAARESGRGPVRMAPLPGLVRDSLHH